MVFKRRNPRSFGAALVEFFYPRGGWGRAFRYVRHRLHRLPDTPERIGRGIWAGVFVSFTPFFGLHFLLAAILAVIMRGNVIAALLATFFGNPLTFPFIVAVSLELGAWILGREPILSPEGVGSAFSAAFGDVWHNVLAAFTSDTADWSHLSAFYDELFLPYLVGGLVPGVVSATVIYYVSVPIIRAYQQRRRGAIKAKFEALRRRAHLAQPQAEKVTAAMGDGKNEKRRDAK